MKNKLTNTEEKSVKSNNNGITLIAVVATIIILLILVGIIITAVMPKKETFSEEERNQDYTATNKETQGTTGMEGLESETVETELPLNPIIEVTRIKLNKEEENMKVGESIQLIATIEPETATHKEIRWMSSSPTVAMVVNGTVKALEEGLAKIVATTVDGSYTADCLIIVER